MAAPTQRSKVDEDGEDAPTPNKYGKFPEKPLKLIVFSATWCGACRGLKSAKTLEKIAEAHPEVELIHVDVDRDPKMSDEYDVNQMPQVFFEDAQGYVLEESDERTVLSLGNLEKMYARAKAKLE